MATIEYWIQLENHPWDVSPNNVDRMTGQTIKDLEGKDPETGVLLVSPGTGASHQTDMFRPVRDDAGQLTDALILRRYKRPAKGDGSDAWTVPDDRKINPWDINEHDPTDSGTMGTIPGPTIECSVGDDVVVHFRNHDQRAMPGTQKVCFPVPVIGEICLDLPTMVPFPVEQRKHSLHPHGFVFAPIHDGAFPLSPPDASRPIGASQAAAWSSLGVTGHKQGDRVPPGGTFTYHWNTFGWPTTAGVWLYHDHSICDMESTGLGAIGIIVIHNGADVDNEVDIRLAQNKQDATGTLLDPAFLPAGSPTASPVQVTCFPLPPNFPAHILPHDLEGLGQLGTGGHGGMDMGAEGRGVGAGMPAAESAAPAQRTRGKAKPSEAGPPAFERLVQRGELLLELDKKLERFRRFCIEQYVPPPSPDRA